MVHQWNGKIPQCFEIGKPWKNILILHRNHVLKQESMVKYHGVLKQESMIKCVFKQVNHGTIRLHNI